MRTADELKAGMTEADVLLVSMMWRNELAVPPASCGSSSRSAPAPTSTTRRCCAAGIRLASAAGVNAQAVAEHAMALILALARHLPEARDNQTASAGAA